ncbi:MAG: glycoside hydrolase family 5 protein [Candidatus Bathyarchaeota archaeon]|nr:glycoside hydrolase family 5 protein [Candidatus Bathyarchaeota archaeon]
MKRIVLLVTLLLLILPLNVVQSLGNRNTISSYGTISYGTTTNTEHGFWWGTVVSDTAWEHWGSYFSEIQIDILKQSGATAVRIMLDKSAWDSKDTNNVLSIPYPDYIKKVVEWCNPEIRVLLDLTRDTSNPSWTSDAGFPAKLEIITTSSLRNKWINWGKEVISYCNPDAIGLMNEPGGGGQKTTFDYYYDNFVIPSINAYRAIDPNISIFVMSMPFIDLSGFAQRPINDPNVFYEWHLYYDSDVQLEDTSTRYYNTVYAYVDGNLAEAKDYLYQYFDWKFSGIPSNKINIGECGVASMSGDVPTDPNWDAFMKDLYSYTKEHGLNGMFQYGFTKRYYRMLYTTYQTLNPYGDFWAQNVPV